MSRRSRRAGSGPGGDGPPVDELQAEIEEILFLQDPIGISYGNRFEYDPEAGTIWPRLSTRLTLDEVLDVVHEEFAHWFGPAAGPRTRYESVALAIWQACRRRAPF
ncbi:MAG TPA: hypothetical protein VIA06_10450 [Candidatus Dormibacteraeota bacterium]|jgi:hypothetical protein|nr:hypothetical protein [Candidatus Dormibacteraeota bacterium]